MNLGKLNKLIENLLKNSFTEEDLIFVIRSNSAKLVLEKWGKLVQEEKNITN